MTISAFSDEQAQVRTKKKEFLSQIERIVPWKEWLAMIQPCYYKGERGNKPYPLEIMLRLYLLQNLYDLSDEATVAEAIDSRAFSEFCSVDSSNQVPDGDTLGRFRNLLIRNGLQEKLFAQVVAALMERGLILKKGTIVDSTIISAPSSTKNKEKKRKQCLWRAICETPRFHGSGSEGFLLVEALPQSPQNTESVFWKRWKVPAATRFCKSLNGYQRPYFSVSLSAVRESSPRIRSTFALAVCRDRISSLAFW